MKNEVRIRGGLLIIGFVFSLGLIAQHAVLEGRVYSRESFENISHANLILRNNEGLVVTSITTGFDGHYKTDSLQAGAYKLEVFAKEFKTEAIEIIYLQPGKTARIDISMSKNVISEIAKVEVGDSEEDSETNPTDGEPEKKFRLFEFIGDIMKTSAIAAF